MLTAGESHGRALVTIVEGMPAGLPLEAADIDRHLARRQQGHGRGARMAIERDRVEILAGVRHGQTLGSPVALLIENRDWANWQATMAVQGPSPADPAAARLLTRPRPGHADLAGGLKYGHKDLRNVLERASARETAARVAAGSVARRLLEELGIEIASRVVSIGQVKSGVEPPHAAEAGGDPPDPEAVAEAYRGLARAAEASPVRCADPDASRLMVAAIDAARRAGETLGGVFEVVAWGVPPGLGSHVQWDRRLDGRLAQAFMSIQAVKGVEIGLGFEAACRPGSRAHDEILLTTGEDARRGAFRLRRASNRAGGLEGGMTNGQPVVVRAALKPIATLVRPLESVDLATMTPARAGFERSDACAVPAAAVIGEAVLAWCLAEALLEKTGGDSLAETRRNLEGYLAQLEAYPR